MSAFFVLAAGLAAALPGTDVLAGSIGMPERNPTLLAPPDVIPEKKKPEPEEPSPVPGMDFSKILKPILEYKLSDSDKAHLGEVVRSAYAGNGSEAAKAIERIQDPAAKKLATWYAYKSDNAAASAQTIERFRLENPLWPSRDDLREEAEARLFFGEARADEIEAFFQVSPPETGAGKAALAEAYLSEGNKDEAQKLIVSAWRQHRMSERAEKKILEDFDGMLSEADHQARVDMLLYPDKNSLLGDAERTAKLLPEKKQKVIEARIAVVKRSSNAGKLLEALPKDGQDGDVGLLFNRIQYLRRNDKEEEAWTLLLSAPQDPAKLIDMEEWWIERRINCRAALQAHNYEAAYRIAAEHGPLEGEDFDEAEFMAGWIALRFRKDPKTALTHFVALKRAADDSNSMSRAEYWLGRTAEALGDRNTAIIHYAAAARFPQHYYGQLGRQALDAKPARLAVTGTPRPSEADIQRFLQRDSVRAIGVAMAADSDYLAPLFYISLARTLNSPEEVVLLAELAKRCDHRQMSIRLAKIAFNRDMPVGDYALPVGMLPDFVRLADKVDVALVHALSRQESEFNAEAKSPAGARGLMQLMPSTAKLIARQFKVKYSLASLTNAAYNVQLGEAHLGDLINNYDGSYFMALVAYNAGPGRVRDWVEAYGDPRDPNVDPVDWVESIPYTETRNYVIKIMESLQLYRSRLHGEDGALQLWQDLNRGKRDEAEEAEAMLWVEADSN
ncbi:lytic transglycosylase domain-containing protein [Methyloligella sp. 2.7D]|uniref:lytic transglycosylase domain-containing protein n=1 Tax=unclassified Methyloligella TaxID=2625955 RepID=UPI00157D69B0|nr:lytic transglycosylase domain-containing protein [Methyloligella sp. GL2]QKP77625.1 lytic transglycosylase domain-containing protein [Methyloligella sp. GL2]